MTYLVAAAIVLLTAGWIVGDAIVSHRKNARRAKNSVASSQRCAFLHIAATRLEETVTLKVEEVAKISMETGILKRSDDTPRQIPKVFASDSQIIHDICAKADEVERLKNARIAAGG